MKIATWNVNSLKVRLPHLLDWLAATQTDVVCLQETKLEDANFPQAELEQAGYRVVFSGQKTYNGVAILSKSEPTEVQVGIPGFADEQARVIAGTVGGVRVIGGYFPNGQAPGSDKFAYKMRWLQALQDWVRAELATHPKLVLMGDYNIAPTDADVYDPEGWKDQIHCTVEEREHFQQLIGLGIGTPTAEQLGVARQHRVGPVEAADLAAEGGQRSRLLGLLSRRPYLGHDTLAELPVPVRFEVDEAVAAPPDGLALVGWLLDPTDSVAAIRVRSGALASEPLAERWLRTRTDDVDVMTAAGRLCMQAELWGKAQEFLEASVAREETASTRLALAQLLERLHPPEPPALPVGAVALERELGQGNELCEYTGVMIRETERIDHIIRELLELASPRGLNMQPVNLHKILGDILLLQKQAVADRNIACVSQFDPSIPDIMADEALLTRLFLNLVRNALDAMGEDGQLTVTSRVLSDYRMAQNERHSRMVAVEVADDGPGIPGEDLENIWTPFFSTKSTGTGLGLTICHKIVAEHRGMIKVESDPGHGTTFTVLLPLVQ